MTEDSRYRYIVVLGNPGGGKSTRLKYLELQWAKLEPRELTSQPVPLLIELRKYVQSKTQGECKDFLEFINSASTWIGHLPPNIRHEWLKARRCAALFDGLDAELAEIKSIAQSDEDWEMRHLEGSSSLHSGY